MIWMTVILLKRLELILSSCRIALVHFYGMAMA